MKKRKKDAPVERVETPSFTDPQGSWTVEEEVEAPALLLVAVITTSSKRKFASTKPNFKFAGVLLFKLIVVCNVSKPKELISTL